MGKFKFITPILVMSLMAGFSPARAESLSREETVKILQQKYVTVLDEQHQTLLAIKVKMKSEPTFLKQVNAVLADFDSNYTAIIAGLNNPNQELQPIKDLCEEEVEEFGNSIYQLQQMLRKLNTITCTKGKTTKQITGLAPKCPAGFTKKK
jgi:hypothetical protein